MPDRFGCAPEPRLRAVLDEIPPHRGDERTSTRQAVRVSSNESPYPPLPSVIRAIVAAGATVNRYPDHLASDLRHRLARRLDVPTEHLVVGPGSIALIRQAIDAVASSGDEVIYPWRSYDAYPTFVRLAGATGIPVPLTAEEGHDFDALLHAVTERTRLIILCSPNNPTGTVIRRADLERFIDLVPSGILIVLDEAYREFVRDAEAADGLEYCRDRTNICVLRTFSKAFGLAGLRIGYAISHSPVAQALHKTAVAAAVNGIAQRAAIASLEAEEELAERVETLVRERDRVWNCLLQQGWRVPRSEANFVWLRLGNATDAFVAACDTAGLAIRAFAAEGCRITIDLPEANDRFLDVAGQFITARTPVDHQIPNAEGRLGP